MHGLALTAAEQYEPALTAKGSPLDELLDRRTHPFAYFPRETQGPPLPASAVVCGKTLGSVGDWEHCPAPANPEWAQEIAGHIAVIGEFSEKDMHDAVIGSRISGTTLQASYIEALLRGKYFKPVPDYVSVMLFVVWIGLLYLLFWWLEPPELAALVSVGILVGVYVASYLILLRFDYLLTFAIGGSTFAAVAIKWIEVRGHLMREKEPKHKTAVASDETNERAEPAP
jgi:hypothetical protein